MKLNENSKNVLTKRYLAKNENGKPIEDIKGLFKRVSNAIGMVDKDYGASADEVKVIQKRFFDLMTNLEFMPNSPTLMNADRPLGQLSACFVLPVEDSMEGIFESIKNAALIHKSGGGTGFSFSRLRQNGATVNSTGGVASGPVSFMKVFNSATDAVKQGGTRRGANMGILRVDHPDILEFIMCKENNEDMTNFNISVGITENFMKSVFENKEYNLIDPKTKNITGTRNANELFEIIINMAWKNGEPGIIFLDRLNKDNPTPEIGEIESTNPCGEQPLLPYEACNLGSINLKEMVKEKDGKCVIDFNKLKRTVHDGVHFLDNVIDANKYPLKIIDETTKSNRKIGLGIMGWADILCILEIPYDSNEAIILAEKVMNFIQKEGRKKSLDMAKTRGTFPNYEKSIYKKLDMPLRNATITTIAPTGTISMICGVSSGIEPIFALSYIRNVMDNEELIEVNPIFENIIKKSGIYSNDLMKEITKKGSLHDINSLNENIKRVFVTSHDIKPIWHIKMQAAFQKYTDNAVSKTVNLKNEASTEDVKKVYIEAYKSNCKGVTIYRDGSREMQVLNIGEVKGKLNPMQLDEEKGKVAPRPRPEITMGFTEKVKIGCGNLYITVNYDEKGICEVFTNTGRAGGCPSQSEATSRLVSIALRSGLDGKYIVEQLKGIRCPSTTRQKGLKVTSCPDAIGRLIEKVMKYQNGDLDISKVISKVTEESSLKYKGADLEESISSCESDCNGCTMSEFCNNVDKSLDIIKRKCPECESELEHEGGCVVCKTCGYSKCG